MYACSGLCTEATHKSRSHITKTTLSLAEEWKGARPALTAQLLWTQSWRVDSKIPPTLTDMAAMFWQSLPQKKSSQMHYSKFKASSLFLALPAALKWSQRQNCQLDFWHYQKKRGCLLSILCSAVCLIKAGFDCLRCCASLRSPGGIQQPSSIKCCNICCQHPPPIKRSVPWLPVHCELQA